jgi:hypothetical protein
MPHIADDYNIDDTPERRLAYCAEGLIQDGWHPEIVIIRGQKPQDIQKAMFWATEHFGQTEDVLRITMMDDCCADYNPCVAAYGFRNAEVYSQFRKSSFCPPDCVVYNALKMYS